MTIALNSTKTITGLTAASLSGQFGNTNGLKVRMPDEKKGITVKIDAALHAEVREYLESHGMTMAEFVTQASALVICFWLSGRKQPVKCKKARPCGGSG